MLELQISNLGPIKSATLDVDKPLIVLCGPNNSGKTYAATVVYALCKVARERFFLLFSEKECREILKPGKAIDVLSLCREKKKVFFEEFEQELIRYIPHVFGVSGERFQQSKVIILNADDHSQAMKNRGCLPLNDEVGKYKGLEVQSSEGGSVLQVLSHGSRGGDTAVEFFGPTLEGLLRNFLITFRRPYFFPAERNSINLFARDLLLNRNEYLNRSLFEQIDGETKPRPYSLAIQENIRFMEEVSNLVDQESEFRNLAGVLEKDALNGQVKVSPEQDLMFLPDGGEALDAGMTSSLVKSLSGLVFYFRHIASAQDIIFIDEPEANLHPHVQRILARVLVSAVNRGIKLVMSTHSEVILQELNNLVMLSQKSDKARELATKYDITQEQVLDPEKLAVYVFDGETESLKIEEHGFDVTSISRVIDQQAAASQDIFYSLFD